MFDGNNWNQPQTVTVTGVDDAETDGDVDYNVSLIASSQDAYDGVERLVTLTNQDNEGNGTDTGTDTDTDTGTDTDTDTGTGTDTDTDTDTGTDTDTDTDTGTGTDTDTDTGTGTDTGIFSDDFEARVIEQ